MSWTEVSPGFLQRPMGENERFIKLMGDLGQVFEREHWSINADAVIKPNPSYQIVKRFESAWKALRFQHPSIAAVAKETTIDYTVPNAMTLDEWFSKTFFVNSSMTREDVVASLKPSAHATLHVFPNAGEVLLHTSHWRTDGIGVLQLLNAFLELASSDELEKDAANLPWGEEVTRLTPSIEEAASIPTASTEKIRLEAMKWTSTFHGVPDTVGVQLSVPKNTAPKGTRSTRATLTKGATAAVVDACKERDITVTSAVHAALASANWEFASANDKTKHFSSTIRAGLRSYLPKEFHTPANAAGLYTTGYMDHLPAGLSFEENCQHYKELYKRPLTADYIQAHRQYASNLHDLFTHVSPGAPSPSNADISSLGVADDLVRSHHRHFEVTNISTGVEILTPQMLLVLFSFRGRLNMVLLYNEAFHSPTVIAEILAKVKNTLLRELDAHEEMCM